MQGESNKLFTEAGVPTTFLHASFYWTILFISVQDQKEGQMVNWPNVANR
jgi:hypothetical protein